MTYFGGRSGDGGADIKYNLNVCLSLFLPQTLFHSAPKSAYWTSVFCTFRSPSSVSL